MAQGKQDWFQRLWSTRHDPRKYAKKPPARATLPDATKEDRLRNAIIDAAERRRRQWQRYIAARKHRLDELAKTHPGVARYRATLKSLIRDPEVEWTGPRDCNVDLAALCEELALGTIPREYDRYLLLEITRDAITAIGKRCGVEVERLVDDREPLPTPEAHTANEVDRVKTVLRLR